MEMELQLHRGRGKAVKPSLSCAESQGGWNSPEQLSTGAAQFLPWQDQALHIPQEQGWVLHSPLEQDTNPPEMRECTKLSC